MRRSVLALIVFFIILTVILFVRNPYKSFKKDVRHEIVSDNSWMMKDAAPSQLSRIPSTLPQVSPLHVFSPKTESSTDTVVQPTMGSQNNNMDKMNENANNEVEVEKLRRQQERYKQLESFLPRYHELSKLYADLQKRRPEYPGDGASEDEIQAWREAFLAFRQEEVVISREQIELLKTLAELFPEAIEIGSNYGSIDYRKLRELVGGRLPVDNW